MSERIKKAAGIALMTASLLLCLLCVALSDTKQQDLYLSGDRQFLPTEKTETETNGIVKVNSANETELKKLDGIGETYAAMIIDERLKNGPFYYPEDLTAVRGIGPRTLEKLRKDIDLAAD